MEESWDYLQFLAVTSPWISMGSRYFPQRLQGGGFVPSSLRSELFLIECFLSQCQAGQRLIRFGTVLCSSAVTRCKNTPAEENMQIAQNAQGIGSEGQVVQMSRASPTLSRKYDQKQRAGHDTRQFKIRVCPYVQNMVGPSFAEFQLSLSLACHWSQDHEVPRSTSRRDQTSLVSQGQPDTKKKRLCAESQCRQIPATNPNGVPTGETVTKFSSIR